MGAIVLRAVQVNDLARNCKKICDEAFAGNPVIVARPKKENVVLISESAYLALVKAQEEAHRAYVLHELEKAEREGDAPGAEWFNREEAMKKVKDRSWNI